MENWIAKGQADARAGRPYAPPPFGPAATYYAEGYGSHESGGAS